MRSVFCLSVILIINYASAIPGAQNYVAPSSNSTRDVRQAENLKNLEDVLAERPDDSEDVGPLGEVQLDVEEEDIGEVAQPKVRVRRGYNNRGQQKSQPKSKHVGGQSNSKYGSSGGSGKYGSGQQQQQPQQSQYGQQQSSGGKYGGGQQQASQGGRGGY